MFVEGKIMGSGKGGIQEIIRKFVRSLRGEKQDKERSGKPVISGKAKIAKPEVMKPAHAPVSAKPAAAKISVKSKEADKDKVSDVLRKHEETQGEIAVAEEMQKIKKSAGGIGKSRQMLRGKGSKEPAEKLISKVKGRVADKSKNKKAAPKEKKVVKKKAVKKKKRKKTGKKTKPSRTVSEKRRRAALAGWRTRRRKLRKKLEKLEKSVQKSEDIENKISVLREKLIKAREKEAKRMEKQFGKVSVKEKDISAIRNVAQAIEKEIKARLDKAPVEIPTIIYSAESPEANLGIDDEILMVEKMIKALEVEFYKRRISAQEFKKRMFEYQQELKVLKARKRAVEAAKKERNAGRGESVESEENKGKGGVYIGTGRGPSAGKGKEIFGTVRTGGTPVKVKNPAGIGPSTDGGVVINVGAPGGGVQQTTAVGQQQGGFKGNAQGVQSAGAKTPEPSGKESSNAGAVPKADVRKVDVRKSEGEKKDSFAEVAKDRSVSRDTSKGLGAKTKLGKIVEEKAGGKINQNKLKKLEDRMNSLISKHGLDKQEMEFNVRGLRSDRVLDNFETLISMLEAKKKIEKETQMIKKAPVETVAPGEVLKGVKKFEPVGEGVKCKKIVTDFDRIISKVEERNEISLSALGKELGLDKKRVESVIGVLEDKKLIKLHYPAIGEPIISKVGYERPPKIKGGKNAKNKSEGKRGEK